MDYKVNNFALNSDVYIVIHNKIRSMINNGYTNKQIKEEIQKANNSFDNDQLTQLIRTLKKESNFSGATNISNWNGNQIGKLFNPENYPSSS